MIQCSKCQRVLEKDCREVSISGSIMGDEYIDSYYLCQPCQVYTVEVYHDRFLGEDEVSFRGPLSQDEAQAKIDLIRQCSEPWNKKCGCPAHREYFGDWLD